MNPPVKRERLPEISLLNVFFCLLVVFIHASSETLGALDRTRWPYTAVMLPWRFASIAVQGFFMLGGLRLCLREERPDWGRYYLSRLKRVYLPYLAWVGIYYLYFWMRHYYAFSLRELVRYAAVGDLVAHLYYVVTAMQFYLLAPLWRALVRRVHPLLGIGAALLISQLLGQYLPSLLALADVEFLYNDRIFTTYLVWWIIGCYAGRYYDAFRAMLRENSLFLTAAFVACALGEGVLSWLQFTGRRSIGYLEPFHFAYVLSAVLFCAMLAFALTEGRALPGWLQWADRCTYGVYLCHCLPIFAVNALLSSGALAEPVRYALRLAAAYGVSFGLMGFWRLLCRLARRVFKGGRSAVQNGQ